MGSDEEKHALLSTLWRDRIHAEPRALELSPASVRHAFENVWQPADTVIQEIEGLPSGLISMWQSTDRGHLVLTHRPSVYKSGPQLWREGTLESVCYLSITDIHGDTRRAMLAVFMLIDHLLGSCCDERGPLFSEGHGVTDSLGQLARQFGRIYRLGHGVEELGAVDAPSYFSSTIWLFMHESRRLNVIDPLIHRLYRTKLFSNSFWSQMN
jgi:hypothetical protein